MSKTMKTITQNLFEQKNKTTEFLDSVKDLFKNIEGFSEKNRIVLNNEIKKELHKHSPFKNEPVDCVVWEKEENVISNDYNPNSVAPPEMELLRHSVNHDGYTQPVVTWKNDSAIEVVDGFHRKRICKECKEVNERVLGYLPIVHIQSSNVDRNDRIASTIRHNRARGKHRIDAMSDIVIELKNRNWKNERIARELGMEEDEILRLCQITGLADLFSDDDFSRSWDVENSSVEDFEQIEEDEIDINSEEIQVRTVNTNDDNRIFHKWDKWECYRAGFYENKPINGLTKEQCEQMCADFLSNSELFENTLNKVVNEWKFSCEHYLTNCAMNRIAWLGQAAMCYHTKVPAIFRSGFNKLSEQQQLIANNIALKYLNVWLKNNQRDEVSLENAMPSRQSTIY